MKIRLIKKIQDMNNARILFPMIDLTFSNLTIEFAFCLASCIVLGEFPNLEQINDLKINPELKALLIHYHNKVSIIGQK